LKPTWRDGLAARLPFFYGWIILACVCCAGFARNGPAVATLSIFVEPMTSDFGWSRTALSGAVSLGGIMAALVSPLIGPILDRRGARMMLCAAVLVTGLSTMLLSLTQSLLAFYVFFCIARMNFAGPFDIGIYGALNSWFVERRALASSIVNLAQMVGLIALPLIAHFAMQQQGWRAGWLAVGIAVLLVGFVPTWLFMVRRPEDVGLLPDGRSAAISSTGATISTAPATIAALGISACDGPLPLLPCAKVSPPRSLMAFRPSEPSLPLPESSIPMAASPRSSASAHRKTSILVDWLSAGRGCSTSFPSLIVRIESAGAR